MTSPKGQTRSAGRTPAPAEYVSPSMEVLETLEMQNALSNLEARLDSLEIDLARAAGSREDDARRLAGEMAVMRARVEDALEAVAETSDELRETYRKLEKRIDEIARSAEQVSQAELRAGIDGTMAGVGDALGSMTAEIRGRIDALAEQMHEVRAGMIAIADRVSGPAPEPPPNEAASAD